MNHGVVGYHVEQRVGNAVFIPAGCPHQVCNYLSCVKIAMDFVYPGNIEHCLKLGEEFRVLSAQHKRKEDLLGPKRMIFYGWQSLKDRVFTKNKGDQKKKISSMRSAPNRSVSKGKRRTYAEGFYSDDDDAFFASDSSNAVKEKQVKRRKTQKNISIDSATKLGGENVSNMKNGTFNVKTQCDSSVEISLNVNTGKSSEGHDKQETLTDFHEYTPSLENVTAKTIQKKRASSDQNGSDDSKDQYKADGDGYMTRRKLSETNQKLSEDLKRWDYWHKKQKTKSQQAMMNLQ